MRATLKILFGGAAALALMLALATPAEAVGIMFIKANKVGIGVDPPTQLLHVKATDGTAQVFVQEASGTFLERVLFRLSNNGPARFSIANSGAGGGSWSFKTRGAGMQFFDVSKDGTGVAEASFDSATGNMTISGTTYNTGSSRELKQDFERVDGVEILHRLTAMPLSEWSSKRDPETRHIGPVAEEWWATFGLGPGDKNVSLTDVGGVALAAIQGLNEELERRDARIDELEAQIAELRRLIAAR